MNPSPAPGTNRGSMIQLYAVLFVTLLVMILGVAVVLAPDRMGVPRPAATAVATPLASPAR